MRKTGVILLGFLVGLFLVVASWPYLSYQVENPAGVATGNSIREAVDNFYETSSVSKRIFILAQILLLVIIIAAVFIILAKFQTKKVLSKVGFIKTSDGKRSHTDLDVLYAMLKSKGEISMEDIEEVFKVNPGIALGWSKVLENGDLAELYYPRFGKPVLRLAREANADEAKNEEVSKHDDGADTAESKDDKAVRNNLLKKKLRIRSSINKEKIIKKNTKKTQLVIRKAVVSKKKAPEKSKKKVKRIIRKKTKSKKKTVTKNKR